MRLRKCAAMLLVVVATSVSACFGGSDAAPDVPDVPAAEESGRPLPLPSESLPQHAIEPLAFRAQTLDDGLGAVFADGADSPVRRHHDEVGALRWRLTHDRTGHDGRGEPRRRRSAAVKGARAHLRRHYYFDVQKAMDAPHTLDEAIVAVDENRQVRSDFGRKIDLDPSTRELECKQLYFPCSQIMRSDDWEATLHRVAPDQFGTYMGFRGQVLAAFRNYQLPVIQLRKETSKEAVCLVFEKVNTGGVQLSVFELITASYAADGYNLRDDWFGSRVRKVESRKERLEKDSLLRGIEAELPSIGV